MFASSKYCNVCNQRLATGQHTLWVSPLKYGFAGQQDAILCETIKFFAMITQIIRKLGNFRFAPELRETNQMAV